MLDKLSEFSFEPELKAISKNNQKLYLLASVIDFILILIIVVYGIQFAPKVAAPLIKSISPLHPLTAADRSEASKGKYEVMGFAPHWTLDELENVDFNILTTIAYFGVPVLGSGDLDVSDPGYKIFKSRQATDLFKTAHDHETRVVLTLTQMKNQPIIELLDNPEAQQKAINQAVDEVQNRGIDGINIDFEYSGDPGDFYRQRFSEFVALITSRMHQLNPNSYVTVSVYAASVKEPKLYDVAALGAASDGVFMMAYDFAVASSDHAIPTAPLNGHKSGKYWYDVSTAVEDFLTVIDPQKLILGVPYYGYNYLVYQPEVKAQTRPKNSFRGKTATQTYSISQEYIRADAEGVSDYFDGWDEDGQVGYRAYYSLGRGTWRMLFLDDYRSLGLKYDFAKSKGLAGVGMWALGFDHGKAELWDLLREKFGIKSVNNLFAQRQITGGDY